MAILVKLFLTFLKIGAFSFGGGYAILAFIEKEIVTGAGWLSPSEFIDVVAISQMTPGPIAVNASTYVGYKTAGFLGALSGTLGVITLSFVLIVFAASKLEKNKDTAFVKGLFTGLRPTVLGLIGAAAYSISISAVSDFKGVMIAFIALFGVLKFRWHPILIIAMAGLAGSFLW